MIVQIKGNVKYEITLDPTVWIFDDRKIMLEELFSEQAQNTISRDEVKHAAQRWSAEVSQQRVRPPVNKSITRMEREKILVNSYAMPFQDFLTNAEPNSNASAATLITNNEDIHISLSDLMDSYFLFALKGKPLKDDGPIHLLLGDGSNKDTPIKGIKKIVIQ